MKNRNWQRVDCYAALREDALRVAAAAREQVYAWLESQLSRIAAEMEGHTDLPSSVRAGLLREAAEKIRLVREELDAIIADKTEVALASLEVAFGNIAVH